MQMQSCRYKPADLNVLSALFCIVQTTVCGGGGLQMTAADMYEQRVARPSDSCGSIKKGGRGRRELRSNRLLFASILPSFHSSSRLRCDGFRGGKWKMPDNEVKGREWQGHKVCERQRDQARVWKQKKKTQKKPHNILNGNWKAAETHKKRVVLWHFLPGFIPFCCFLSLFCPYFRPQALALFFFVWGSVNWPAKRESFVLRGILWNWPLFDWSSVFERKGSVYLGRSSLGGSLMHGTARMSLHKHSCLFVHDVSPCVMSSVQESTIFPSSLRLHDSLPTQYGMRKRLILYKPSYITSIETVMPLLGFNVKTNINEKKKKKTYQTVFNVLLCIW